MKRILEITLVLFSIIAPSVVFADNSFDLLKSYETREKLELDKNKIINKLNSNGYCKVETFIKKDTVTNSFLGENINILEYNNKKIYDLEEIIKIKKLLQEDNENYIINIEQTGPFKEYYKAGEAIIKKFDSKELRDSFINSLNNYTKLNENDELENFVLEKKFQTLEEAKDYRDNFINDHKNYVIDTNKIDKVNNSSKDQISLKKYTFDNLSDAESKKTALESLNNENEVHRITITPVKDGTYSETKDIEKKEFSSYLEASNYINSFINTYGKNNVSYNIVKKTTESTKGLVTSAIKIDESKKEYVLNYGNYILIKQGAKGHVAIWTINPLTSAEQNRLLSSYLKYNNEHNVDGSTNQIISAKFISGYGIKDLSSIGNGWGNDYEFKTCGDKIILKIPSKKVSHIVYGNISLNNLNEIYEVTGTYKKLKDKYIYYLNDFITLKGFDYKLVLKGNYTTYMLYYNEKLFRDYWLINAFKKKVIYQNKDIFKLDLNANKCKTAMKYLGNKNSDLIYTGDKENYIFEVILISASIALISIILIKRRLYN